MDYFASMLFMLIASKGNFTSYFDVFFFLLDAVMIYVGVTHTRFRKKDFQLFFRFSAFYFAFVTLRFFILNDIPIHFLLSDTYFYLTRIVTTFLFCSVLREKTVPYMVKTTYHLAIISLVFFVLQRVSPSSVAWVGRLIDLPPRVGNPGYTNFIIFTFDDINHFSRNSGFSWEPGAYGTFLDIILLLALVMNGFKFDRKVAVLLAAIVTTQSTTTYIGVVVIALLYLRVNGMKLSTLVLILVPVIVVVAIEVPFLLDKIKETYEEDAVRLRDIDTLSDWYLRHGGQLHLNRFGSAVYLWNTYRYQLLWGISNAFQDTSKISLILNLSNGDVDFMAKYGLIGLYYLLYRFGVFLKKFLYKKEYIFYCVLLILILGFGEPMLVFISTLSFLFIADYIKPEMLFKNEEPEPDPNEELVYEEVLQLQR